MVIMLHTGITYGAVGGWYCTDVNRENVSAGLQVIYQLFNTITQAYSMGFFFIIAGYFTAASFQRKGSSQFLKDRLLRLGIPLVIYAALIAPLTIGFAQVLREGSGHMLDGFYWIYVNGNYECGPMWFVQALLIFSLLYVLGNSFINPSKANPNRKLPSHVYLLLAAIVTGIFAFALRLQFPVGQNYFGMQLGYFSSYIVLFFTGCAAYKYRWLERVHFKYALPWILVTLLSVIFLLIPREEPPNGSYYNGGFNTFSLTYSMWEPFAAWGIILGFLYVSRRFLSGTNGFLKHLGRCTYPVYFIHPPVLVGLTLLAHNWQAAPALKWITITAATCVCCWLIASVLIKLPGLKRIF
jgi:surface polysaccharide O-acyltransferase-like enzyme